MKVWTGVSVCGAVFACSFGVGEAQAATAGNRIGIAMGYADGGEPLLRAEFEEGVEDQTIRAGTGFLFMVHGMWSPWVLASEHVRLGPRAAFGVKLAEVVASNGKIQLCRFPFELGVHGLFALNSQAHIVVSPGPTYEMWPALTGTDDFAALNVSADNAIFSQAAEATSGDFRRDDGPRPTRHRGCFALVAMVHPRRERCCNIVLGGA
jgi:hypothetical protein